MVRSHWSQIKQNPSSDCGVCLRCYSAGLASWALVSVGGTWRKKSLAYASLAHTVHTQDPSVRGERHFGHTLCLHALHWLEPRDSLLKDCWQRPQLRWLYLPLPRLAPFLLVSCRSDFSFLRWNAETEFQFDFKVKRRIVVVVCAACYGGAAIKICLSW